MNNYWTTADGRKILYEDLEDSHLKNIINDGYRSTLIEEEAVKRGFEVPERLVDKLSYQELFTYIESFSSTAISGNKFSEQMIKLWESNKPVFFLFLNKFLEKTLDKGE